MNIWVTGDWHIGHEKIKQYCNRPNDFNRLIVKNHQYIDEKDLLINLGDLFLGDPEEIRELLKEIKCRHYLIMGNHDQRSKSFYHDLGFSFVGNCAVINNIFFTHCPIEYLPNIWLGQIFAHCHQKQGWLAEHHNWMRRKYFCYSPELESYQPLPLTKVIGRMEREYKKRNTL